MIDEAFYNLSDIIANMSSPDYYIEDVEAGVKSYVESFTVQTPIELDIINAETVNIGIVPPIYKMDLGFMPVFHNITVTLEKNK